MQEDWYLLAEEDAAPPADEGLLPAGENLAAGFEYDAQDHLEEHPSGKQHVFLSCNSCFSFRADSKHLKTMNAIHHPNVPGWYYSLVCRLRPVDACPVQDTKLGTFQRVHTGEEVSGKSPGPRTAWAKVTTPGLRLRSGG